MHKKRTGCALCARGFEAPLPVLLTVYHALQNLSIYDFGPEDAAPSGLCLPAEQPCQRRERRAQRHAQRCRQQRRQQRPFCAAGLAPDGPERRRARPVQQEKQHGTHGGRPRPAVGGQQRVHLRQPERIAQTALRQIPHHGDRQHDLVGRKSEHECQQQHAVHAHHPPERVERTCAPSQQARAADMHVCQRPKNHPGRRGHGGRAPEHEQRPVEHGAHDDLPDLRCAVRRQLQCEGRRSAAQHGHAQQPRRAERQPHAQHERRREQQRTDERAAAGRGKEHGHERDERRKPPVARHEAVGQHGEQPLALGVDDPAADHARRVAAETHAHRQRLLAARMAGVKRPVEVIRHARQIPRVLEQREQRKKDGHRRQHHGHDPRQRPEHAVHQQPLQPERCVQRREQCRKLRLHPAERARQPFRRGVRARDRQPQHARQPQQHDGSMK